MRGFIIWVLFAFSAICRAAAGGEAGALTAAADPASILWQILVDNGPLGLFLAYMLHRENKRDKLDAEIRQSDEKKQIERDAKEEERRREWIGVIKNITEAMTHHNATMARLCVEVEKTRVTSYQVRDVVKNQADGLWEPEVKGNTRIMTREE